MSKRSFTAACAVLLLIGCGSDSSGPETFLDGSWTLTSVNGDSLPTLLQPASANNPVRMELLSGSLHFESSGTFADVAELRFTQSGVVTVDSDTIRGNHSLEGRTIRFKSPAAGTYTAFYDQAADQITTITGGFALRYTR